MPKTLTKKLQTHKKYAQRKRMDTQQYYNAAKQFQNSCKNGS